MEPDQLRERLHQAGDKPAAEHQNNQEQNSRPRKDHNPQELFSWNAPIRAYKKKSMGVLRFYIAVAILLTLIAVFFKEYVLIVPIWATMFLVYVLTITPPPTTRHTITKFGITTGDMTYRWEFLSHFYFIRKFDYTILVIFQASPLVHPLYLVLPDQNLKQRVLHVLSDHIVYIQKPQKTLTDKMAEWLTELMPEEENRAPASTPQEPPRAHQTYAPNESHPHQMTQ